MKKGDQISEELAMAGGQVLLTISRQMPYTVPTGYFNGLQEQVSACITASESIDPQPAWSRDMPYNVPAAYFDTLAANIIARSQAVDEAQALPRSNPFAVPGDYFETFSSGILSRIKAEEEQAPVPVPKTKRVPLFRSLQLAASVALILFSGLAILRVNNRIAPLTATTAAIDFSGVSKETINEYVMQNIDDFDTDLIVSSLGSSDKILDAGTGTSDDEIEAYLNEDGWN